MNQKLCKRIRQAIPHWRMAIHETFTVSSTRKHYTTTLYATKDRPNESVLKDTAIQVRLQAGCPKQLYKRMKRYVQANRV